MELFMYKADDQWLKKPLKKTGLVWNIDVIYKEFILLVQIDYLRKFLYVYIHNGCIINRILSATLLFDSLQQYGLGKVYGRIFYLTSKQLVIDLFFDLYPR